jgi:hypothetical protein
VRPATAFLLHGPFLLCIRNGGFKGLGTREDRWEQGSAVRVRF